MSRVLVCRPSYEKKERERRVDPFCCGKETVNDTWRKVLERQASQNSHRSSRPAAVQPGARSRIGPRSPTAAAPLLELCVLVHRREKTDPGHDELQQTTLDPAAGETLCSELQLILMVNHPFTSYVTFLALPSVHTTSRDAASTCRLECSTTRQCGAWSDADGAVIVQQQPTEPDTGSALGSPEHDSFNRCTVGDVCVEGAIRVAEPEKGEGSWKAARVHSAVLPQNSRLRAKACTLHRPPTEPTKYLAAFSAEILSFAPLWARPHACGHRPRGRAAARARPGERRVSTQSTPEARENHIAHAW